MGEFYVATVRQEGPDGPSEIRLKCNLDRAKRGAMQSFGKQRGATGHEILIFDSEGELVASRTIGERRWHNTATPPRKRKKPSQE